jgi:hypothetical protein
MSPDLSDGKSNPFILGASPKSSPWLCPGLVARLTALDGSGHPTAGPAYIQIVNDGKLSRFILVAGPLSSPGYSLARPPCLVALLVAATMPPSIVRIYCRSNAVDFVPPPCHHQSIQALCRPCVDLLVVDVMCDHLGFQRAITSWFGDHPAPDEQPTMEGVSLFWRHRNRLGPDEQLDDSLLKIDGHNKLRLNYFFPNPVYPERSF